MTKKIIITSFLVGLTLTIGLPLSHAQVQNSIVDTTDSAYQEGNYVLDDFTILAIRASNWVLGVVGSLSLLMFVYGGLMFLISAGNSQSIDKAKKILIAAVVGLVIVFSSFLIIKFVLKSMGIDWNGKKMDLTTQGLVEEK